MNRPHQVWLLFAVILGLAAGGLGWLTRQALELDRAEAVARQQAEQEERVGLALWRMDAFLMPLLVQEASRPDFVYSANYLTASVHDGEESQDRTLSPLLEMPPEFVRLHFQLSADGTSSSPQAPQGEELNWSLDQGVASERIAAARGELTKLSRQLAYDDLLEQLPELTPSIPTVDESPPNVDPILNRPGNNAPQVVQSFAQQQLARLPQADETNPPQAPPGRAQTFNQNDTSDIPQTQGRPSQFANEFNNFLSSRRNPQQGRDANTDLSSRNSVYQAYASKASADNLKNFGQALVVAPLAMEGVSKPLWVGSELILARRVERGGATYIQGCWLDWPALSDRLRKEAYDVLPQLELRPAGVGDVARSLATLPVQVIAPAPGDDVPAASPIRLTLALAWIGLFVAALAAAVTLYSVIALSERRAAFVAAVTHELRTPLTTFRMYAEMLAGGMVPREKQATYLSTLRVEADRLAHLVDNVLQYARLERGRRHAPSETVDVATIVERISPRLASRAEQAGLQLEVSVPDSTTDARLTVDAAALEQIIFNLVDNACKYAAHGQDTRLHLEVERSVRGLEWRVRDHGPGIPVGGRRRLFRPFSKTVQEAAVTAPGVGLGLALSQRLAGELGGDLRLVRSDADGTEFALTLPMQTAKPD